MSRQHRPLRNQYAEEGLPSYGYVPYPHRPKRKAPGRGDIHFPGAAAMTIGVRSIANRTSNVREYLKALFGAMLHGKAA